VKRKVLIASILLLSGAIVWLLFGWDPRLLKRQSEDASHAALELAARPTGGDFTLSSPHGPVRLADFRGQAVLLYFGYTACPDVCPTNLAFIAAALRELSEAELARVQVLFVSVDPERDTLQRLADYAGYFHPKVLGITGSPEQIAEVADLYGAAYRRSTLSNSAMGYLVDHTSYTYVIDPAGKLIRVLDHATPPGEIRRTLLTALGQAP
jgi:protein SCO1